MNEEVKKVEVTIETPDKKQVRVVLSDSAKVYDLAKEVANKFGDEATKEKYKGFRLIYGSKSLSKNEPINGFINGPVYLALNDDICCFSWDGDPIEEREEEAKEQQSSWPWLRITLVVMNFLELSLTIAGYMLNFPIAILIVLIVLLVIGTIGVVGWRSLLRKILPEGCLKKLNLEVKNEYEERWCEEIRESENKPRKNNVINNGKSSYDNKPN